MMYEKGTNFGPDQVVIGVQQSKDAKLSPHIPVFSEPKQNKEYEGRKGK